MTVKGVRGSVSIVSSCVALGLSIALGVSSAGAAETVGSKFGARTVYVNACLAICTHPPETWNEIERDLDGLGLQADASKQRWEFSDLEGRVVVSGDPLQTFMVVYYVPKKAGGLPAPIMQALTAKAGAVSLDGPDGLVFTFKLEPTELSPTGEAACSATETIRVGLVDGTWQSTSRLMRW